jgi:2-polyprenyl-3-methyl-5-hydroxy-6-metoxy-1,4-benzoquinol methylase
VFLPQSYRKDIDYSTYKGQEVREQIQKGNNWIKIQRQKLKFDLIRKFQPRGKLFDLGCGWGHFLLAAQELGYDIYGIEISKHLFEYCTQDLHLPVEDKNIFEMQGTQSYDILTMWDVLEHIDDADIFIDKCAEFIRPGGQLVIQVPQIDSYIARKQKEKWVMISQDHVNYFSPRTLTLLLERKGFQVKTVKASLELKIFFMYVLLPWLKSSRSQKVTNADLTATDRQRSFNEITQRPQWQLWVMVKVHNIIYKLLSFLGIGEEMVVVATRI